MQTNGTIHYREYPVDPNLVWVQPNNPLKPFYDKIQKVMEDNFKKAFSGQTDEFFKIFDNYLLALGENKFLEYARAGYSKVEQIVAQGYATEKKQQEVLNALSSSYYANYQVLEDMLLVGVDLETQDDKKWHPTALYTRSIPILMYLERNQQLENTLGEVLQKLEKKLLPSIVKGLQPVIRLDPVSSIGDKPVFKATVPQKSLDVGGDRPYVLIPLGAYYMFANFMKTLGVKSLMNFETTSIKGLKSYNIATSPVQYGKVYAQSGFSNEDILMKLNRMVIGFDLTTLRYYAYNVEDSFYNYGVISFRPEMLNRISPITLNQVNTSQHCLDYPLMRAVYRTKISQLNMKTAEKITFDDYRSYANLNDFKEALLIKEKQLSNRELHALMVSNPDIFGDVEEEVEKRRRLQLRVLKGLKPVELPNSVEERKKLLDDLLMQGVVHIIAKRKTSNTILDVYATNNPNVLRQVLGKDYVKQYETVRIKLLDIQRFIDATSSITRKDLEKLIVEYNLQEYLGEAVGRFTTSTGDVNLIEFSLYIDEVIVELRRTSKERKFSPYRVLYRNLNSSSSKDLYGNVEASNIIAIEFKKFE